jgi:serine protease Do
MFVYAAIAAVGAFSIGQTWTDLVGRAAYAVESGQAQAAREKLGHLTDLSNAFKDVTTAIKPSVVNIRSVRKINMNNQGRRLPFRGQNPQFESPFGDDLFERFFGQPFDSNPRGQQFVQRGMGTGVIVSEDGHVITNNHVIDQADEITVTLSDNRTFDATVVGTDEKTDVAILKIDAPELTPAEFGDSDAISVGDWVVAMGNPFGLTATVTAGIVSATGRANVGIAEYEDFSQTDAAINPGNSGGPLVSLDGRVIGINTAIATRTGGYQGIGFAIPINMVKQIMDAIVKDGKVVRGWLGVSIQNLTQDLANSFNFDGTRGVLIGDVSPNGPADEGGMKAGDIIVKFDGKSVDDMNQLRNRVAATRPGETVEVEVSRDGKKKTLDIKIGELETQSLATRGGQASPENLGMQLQNLTADMAAQLGLESTESGVVVTRVDPAGVAEDAGIRPGDIVLSVGSDAVNTVSDFKEAMAKHNLDEGVRLRLKTGGVQRFVFLKR